MLAYGQSGWSVLAYGQSVDGVCLLMAENICVMECASLRVWS